MALGSWWKVILPFPSVDSLETSFNLKRLARERDEEYRHPFNFAVFSYMERPDGFTVSSLVLYFSPVAASLCVGILDSYSPVACHMPDLDTDGLTLEYGKFGSSDSWGR